MEIKSFSKKQGEIFKFIMQPETALICDGSVRSGKTLTMSIAFVMWAMMHFNHTFFAICGKTVASAERNILLPLQTVQGLPYRMKYKVSDHMLTVYCGEIENSFYLFGGRDESSYMLVQGITLAGVMLDEVALMPQSFVDQAISRTLTLPQAKLWFNCNPDSPSHWFYQEWVLKAAERGARHLHFLMDDNPIMTPESIKKAEEKFSGVFYDRYIRGLWVVAEGLIYPEQAQGRGIVPSIPREYEQYYISVDYGTLNPFSAGLWGLYQGCWYRFGEYRHSGRETHENLTDEEYYTALEELAGDRPIHSVIVDPSAASFIASIERHGRFYVRQANNAVLDGIREVATAFRNGKIAVCENCSGAITEFKSYRWDEKKNEDKPIKENDHAMDDIRYFVMTALQGDTFSFE